MYGFYYYRLISYIENKKGMTSDITIIEKAKGKIGALDQAAISDQDTIDIRVGFNEDGPVKFYTVRFYRDKIGGILVWDYAEIVERS